MNQQRLEELLIAWEENNLTSDELAEFKRLLFSDAAARQRLVETGILGSVAQATVKAWSQPGAQPAPVPSPRSPWRSWSPYAAAACVAIIALAALSMKSSSTPEKIADAPTSPRYVAQLSSSEAAVWDKGSSPVELGENLKACTLQLASGRIELRFSNGALVAVQGPSKFRLVSDERIALMSGRISVDVPKQAIGFTVETPVSAVRDLGTRFGVAVTSDGATEAHVFEGEVSVTTSTTATSQTVPKTLHASEAVSIKSQNAALVPIAAKPSDFPLPG